MFPSSGNSDLSKKGIMFSWHGETELSYWPKSECNSLDNVRAPGGFPLYMEKSDVFRVFLGQEQYSPKRYQDFIRILLAVSKTR